jgi:hypothetical protein
MASTFPHLFEYLAYVFPSNTLYDRKVNDISDPQIGVLNFHTHSQS